VTFVKLSTVVGIVGFPLKSEYAPEKASVIPYPAIVVGFEFKEENTPSNASVIPYPAIVVGVLPTSAKVIAK
jgi:hypothetical protein